MISVDELVKKYDNVYPVKFISFPYMQKDGTVVNKTFIDIDYDEGNRIRDELSPSEKERLRSIE